MKEIELRERREENRRCCWKGVNLILAEERAARGLTVVFVFQMLAGKWAVIWMSV